MFFTLYDYLLDNILEIVLLWGWIELRASYVLDKHSITELRPSPWFFETGSYYRTQALPWTPDPPVWASPGLG